MNTPSIPSGRPSPLRAGVSRTTLAPAHSDDLAKFGLILKPYQAGRVPCPDLMFGPIPSRDKTSELVHEIA